MSIGNVIVGLRAEKEISQKKLADAIGISQSAIAQIEINRNEATSSTIRKLAAFFGVSADYLLELEDDFGARTAIPSAPESAYNSDERTLIENYRELNVSGKKLINETIKTLLATSAGSERKKQY